MRQQLRNRGPGAEPALAEVERNRRQADDDRRVHWLSSRPAADRAFESVAILSAAVAATAAAIALTRLGFVDLQVTAFEVLAVQRLHGL